MSNINKRIENALKYHNMTREEFDSKEGYKRIELLEIAEGKTYLGGQYSLLPEIQKDVTAARVGGFLSGVSVTGKAVGVLVLIGVGLGGYYYVKNGGLKNVKFGSK